MYEYSSTHILLPDSLTTEIIVWGEVNIEDQDLFAMLGDFAFGREYEPHVTILHGLHLHTPDEIVKIIDGSPTFDVRLGRISIFTGSDLYDVVKIDVYSEGLRNLHNKLSRLPHTRFYPVYKPHVTIAYVKKDMGDRHIGNKTFDGKVWQPETLVFSSKRGKKTLTSFNQPQIQVS